MTNNDILRRLRYTFDFSNKAAAALFSSDPASSVKVSAAEFAEYLEKIEDDDEDESKQLSDADLACFLDGLIVAKRGLRDNPGPAVAKAPDFRLSKNDILKKLRIAMNFREEQMLSTLKQGGSELSKSELGAFFRKPNHKHYRACGNQVLRNFIKGLTLQLRTPSTPPVAT
jgi:uncharacterized protein YehS (DUF1456 family)